MRCPHCRSAVVVEIRVGIAGSDFTMHSCPSCEARWWDRDGERVELSRVLSAASAG